MAAPPPQNSWGSRLADFRKYCQQPTHDSKQFTKAVSDLISETEATAVAHIRPNVFLIDPSSTQTLHEQQTSGTATESSSKDKEDEVAWGQMKLRSGNTLARDNDGGDTDMVELGQNESPVPGQPRCGRSKNANEIGSGGDDADYQNEGSDWSNDGDELMVDAREVRELADVDVDDDANDQERESMANDNREPENYISVRGWPRAIPIWEYLGRECTQNIVSAPGGNAFCSKNPILTC